tara:strand:- start:123 stop:428 length:306 start_codon:yes stop_codon:yes gene_type:complete
MTNDIKLTENEIKVLNHCLNYDDDREAQLSDNWSDISPSDIMKDFKWSKEKVGGVISSLEKKELAWSEPESNKYGYVPATLWLTDNGVNAIYNYKENKESA